MLYPLDILVDNKNKKATMIGKCRITKKEYSVTVSLKGLAEYINGALVQKAFPDIPAEDREFLISSISPEGWDLMFGL